MLNTTDEKIQEINEWIDTGMDLARGITASNPEFGSWMLSKLIQIRELEDRELKIIACTGLKELIPSLIQDYTA